MKKHTTRKRLTASEIRRFCTTESDEDMLLLQSWAGKVTATLPAVLLVQELEDEVRRLQASALIRQGTHLDNEER